MKFAIIFCVATVGSIFTQMANSQDSSLENIVKSGLIGLFTAILFSAILI